MLRLSRQQTRGWLIEPKAVLGAIGLVVLLAMAGCAAGGTRGANRSGDELLAALNTGLRPTVLEPEAALPRWSLHERMAHYNVPGVAVAVLKNGRVVAAAGFGVREARTHDVVDADTLFSVGSISKIVAAATTLRLVADGRLDLDRDIGAYLKSWHIPSTPELSHPNVTLRMLMSHTAGFSVHGFKDYEPDEPLPSIVQTLNGTPPAKNRPVRLTFEPGTRMRYSGGGTTVEQMVIEDFAGVPFESVAGEQVLAPLSMRRSTFANPLPEMTTNVAKAHDRGGAAAALPRGWQSFPERAASGLWTSANELGAFVGALIHSYQGRSDFLPQTLAVQMMTEVWPSIHGLGPRLGGEGAARVFYHGGDNDSYHAWIEGYLETGDGFVILTNGSEGDSLVREIRNALSDAIGGGANPPLRAVRLDLSRPIYADYAGTYRLDESMPPDLLGHLGAYFTFDALEIDVAAGAIKVTELGEEPETFELRPLSPSRFVRFGDFDPPLRYEFHRDAHGAVHLLTIDRGNSRLYYRRAAK
jgi:CubicO group peptidase (beta-lactamase class C family)